MPQLEEASPICRGKNLSWETILLFYNSMPREPMPKDKFHSITEAKINGWTQTHSQIARQLAFYYEQDGICYPRFTKETSYKDLFAYMQNWATNYFIPNPYAPSLKGYTPTCIYASIVEAIKSGQSDFDNILDSIFDVQLSSHDKVKVYLSNYTNLLFDTNKVSINNRTLGVKVVLNPNIEIATDVKKYYDYFNLSSEIVADVDRYRNEKESLQVIFYGAPGTGKSHKIKDDENVKKADGKNLVFRTTFHPDSDYSTFVGCYKPTMKPVADKYKAVAGKDEEITYSFVPQAFLQAYVAAWNNPEEKVYLVIEEINRGNCAQIFGDLFQLLDRDCDGCSEYPIMADKDLAKYLNGKDENGQDVLTNKDGIKDGKLRLPMNLYIWATMNTSDQSLFPIDSAFKRRWEWVYMPIDTKKENWFIQVGDSRYSWTAFLDKVNDELLTDETAEDKHLGFYFCKAVNGIISKETFVAKVLFYLWTDVFKVYGIPSVIGSSKEWAFAKFFNVDGSVNETKVRLLLDKIGVGFVSTNDIDNDDEAEYAEAKKLGKESLISIQIPGHPIIKASDSTQFNSFIVALRTIGIERIIPFVDKLKYKRLECPVLSTERYPKIDSNEKGYSYIQEGKLFVVKGCRNYTYVRILEDLNEYLDLGLSLETK